MLSRFVCDGCAHSQSDVFLLLGFLAFLFEAIRRLRKRLEFNQRSLARKENPADYPSKIPVIGHVISMVWNAPAFLDTVIGRFKNVPVRLRLLVTDFYVISGEESIKAVWRAPDLHVRAYKTLAVQNMFHMPKKTLQFWLSDDSGIDLMPHPTSKVPAHLRIDRMTFNTVHRLLAGPGLKPFARRFTGNLLKQLDEEHITSSQWTYVDDMYYFLQEQLLQSAITAMCGEHFLRLNPSFFQDYWDLNGALYILAKGYPRWMCREAYATRDKCVSAVKKWHEFIQPYLSDEVLQCQDWNPFYGADIVQARHRSWARMEEMDADAAASEDLGMIWGANGNSIPSTYWMLAEVLQRPALLARVRKQVSMCRVADKDNRLDFDWTKLCEDPLLQSIYAETLRMKVASFLFRSPERKRYQWGKWSIPIGAVMLISGYNAQMDKTIWEKDGGKPVDEFWAERFLKLPSEPESNPDIPTEPQAKVSRDAAPKSVTFSLEDRKTAWLPYGGGQRMCPGRQLNKQEMITGLAIMVTVFDIELLDESMQLPEPDMRGFGFGALLPKTKTPVRIRRRMQT